MSKNRPPPIFPMPGFVLFSPTVSAYRRSGVRRKRMHEVCREETLVFLLGLVSCTAFVNTSTPSQFTNYINPVDTLS